MFFWTFIFMHFSYVLAWLATLWLLAPNVFNHLFCIIFMLIAIYLLVTSSFTSYLWPLCTWDFTCDQQLHCLLVTPLYLRPYLWPAASLLTCDPFVLETLLVTSSFIAYLWSLCTWDPTCDQQLHCLLVTPLYLRPYLWPAAWLLTCDPFVLETQCQSIVCLWSQHPMNPLPFTSELHLATLAFETFL